MNSCIPQSQEKEILINETIRRTPHRPNEDFISSTHATRISMMSSEESPRPHNASPPSTHSENGEDESTWKILVNFIYCKMEQILAFGRLHYGTMESLLFWMFLPIALPLFIFKTVVYDCIKIRQIFALTLECVIMQLQLIFEMMSCIQRSNSPIDVKVERMGRTFHFLNMFNPVHWIGMLQFYADHTRSNLVPANSIGTNEESQRKNNHLTFADETIVVSEDEEDQKPNENLDQAPEKNNSAVNTESGEKVRSKSRDENSNLNSQSNDDGAVVEKKEHEESF